MSVAVQTPYNSYTGNGSTTVFPYTFTITKNTDLKVYKAGVLQTTGYTVSGVGVSGGGNVTFTPAPANTVLVELKRQLPLNRSIDYLTAGSLEADTLDADIDRSVLLIQDLDYKVNTLNINPDWILLTSKPTTLAGFGITDAATLTHNHTGVYQPVGSYLTGNQTVTLSGDLTGSGTTAITTTLATIGTPGSYTKVTVDTKGRVSGGGAITSTDIPDLDWTKITTGKPTTLAGYGIVDGGGTPAWSVITSKPTTISGFGITDAYTKTEVDSKTYTFASLTSKPTTLTGYGITDAQPLDGDLTSIAGLVGTTGFAKKTAANTWTLDTSTYLTANQTITYSGDISGSGTTSVNLTLPTVNSNVGSFNTLTVNGKGLVTAASNTAYLTGNQTVTLSGDLTGSGTTAITATLNTVPTTKGGTGLTTLGTSLQVLRTNAAATALEWGTVSGGGGGDAYLGNTQTFTGTNTFTNSAIINNSTAYGVSSLSLTGVGTTAYETKIASDWSAAGNYTLNFSHPVLGSAANQTLVNFNFKNTVISAGNVNDLQGATFGSTYYGSMFGVKNYSGGTLGVVPAGQTWSFLTLDRTGAVGTTQAQMGAGTAISNARNLLDDGSSLMKMKVGLALANELVLQGNTTTNSPIISVEGTDTNIGFSLASKGIGALYFNTNTTNRQLQVSNTTSSVNYLDITGGVTGFGPTISALGSDTDIGIKLISKGAGAIQFRTNTSATQLQITNTASAVNYLSLTGNATGAAPTISATGSDTNVALALAGKGTGDITLNGKALSNLVKFDITFSLPTGANGSFTLNEYASFPFTITGARTKTDSGTITANVTIGGTSVTGLGALAITSTQASGTATAANTVSAGGKVAITTSSNATAVNTIVTLSCVRS